MKSLLILIGLMLILLPDLGFSQLTTYTKKSKTGLKYGEKIIYKARRDSIRIGDDSVATIFKKRKTLYVNYRGETIFKDRTQSAQVFSYGSAVLQDKNGLYGAINAEGDVIVQFIHEQSPRKFKRLLLVPFGQSWDLYSPEGIIEYAVDSVGWLNNWLIVYTQKSEPYTYTEKRLFKKDRVKTAYRRTDFINLYNPESGRQIVDEVAELHPYGQFVLLKKLSGEQFLLHNGEEFRVENITDFKEHDEHYISYRKDSLLQLVNRSKKDVIISGKYLKFDFRDQSIHALKDSSQNIDAIDIFDQQGRLLRSDLFYIVDLDPNRFIYKKDSLQFIGSAAGKALSPEFYGFGDANEGYRIVYYRYSYGYMNDASYEVLSIRYPIVAQEQIALTKRKRGLDFIRTVFTSLGNLGKAFVGKAPTPIDHYRKSRPKGVYLKETGHVFHNGWAVVCLDYYDPDKKYETIPVAASNADLHYNYINLKGELLNDKKYLQCSDFHQGKA
ncbi:MAG: hypothetical protein WDZ35_06930 [Crocinitomicaceae bacterium]